jgi:hypothetical protein
MLKGLRKASQTMTTGADLEYHTTAFIQQNVSRSVECEAITDIISESEVFYAVVVI